MASDYINRAITTHLKPVLAADGFYRRSPKVFVRIRDVRAGQPYLAMERWRRAYPEFATGDRPEINSSNFDAVMFYARTLLQVGEQQRARQLLRYCLDNAPDSFKYRESYLHWRQSMIYVLSGEQEESIESLRRESTDGHYTFKLRYFLSWYDDQEYGFLRDQPEFQRHVETIEAELAAQLKRVREMERNGELAPAKERFSTTG
jgi:hypothetical protein